MKTCRTCKVEKSDSEFYRKGDSGLQSRCRACTIVASEKWNSENPEKRIANYKKRRKKGSKSSMNGFLPKAVLNVVKIA